MAFGDHVKVKLGLDSKGFNQGLSNAQAKAQKFGSSFKSGFIGAIGTAVIARASKQIIDFGASIGDLADRVGVTSEFLQKMQFSAEQNGSSVAEANKAIMRLGKSIGDAKDGLSTAVRAFDRAGVTFTKTNGQIKSIEEVAFDLADGLKNMTDDGERVKVAFDLMGRSGLAMTQFMNGGSESMKAFGKRAEELGFILSNDNVKALQDASGELEKLGRQIKVFGAKQLPPLFEKFKKFVSFIQETIKALKPYASSLIQVGKALATYWATAKLIGAGQIIVGGFLAITKAIKATTFAMAGLNLASAKNPFGLLLAGAVLLYPVIKNIVGGTEELQRKLDQIKVDKIKKIESEIERANKATMSMLSQMNLLRQEILELSDIPLPTFKEQVTNLKEQQEQLQKIQSTNKSNLRVEEDVLNFFRKQVEAIKERFKSEGSSLDLKKKLANAEKGVAEQSEVVAGIKLEQTQTERDLLNIKADLVKAEKNLADQEFARANGLEKLLEDRQAEVIELERATARTKALREEGEKGVKALEREFAIHDKIKALMKNGQMTMKEATKLAGDLVDAKIEEKRVTKEIADLQQQQEANAENIKKEVEDRLAKLKAEQALHQQNQAMIDQQLQVLQLQANGQGDLARLLQARIDNEQKLLNIQKNQGLNLQDAVDQQKQLLFLQAKIDAKNIQKEKDDVANNAVAVQGNRKIQDAVDRDDKKRIRAGKEVLRIDQRIAQLKKNGGVFADQEIAKLKARKDEKLKLVLDDQAKKQIAEIDKRKLELQNEFKAQQKALDLAKAKIEKDKADLQADAVAQKQDLKDQADAQALAMQGILDAGKNGIVQATNTMIAKLKQVKLPQINVNQGNGNAIKQPTTEATKVFVVNQLNQQTQDGILTAVRGKFVNQ